jgi:hypothetical protein
MSTGQAMTIRATRAVVILAAAAWTIYWLVAGWAYLQEHSIVVQQGFGGDGIQLWEVFNIKMVAAHHAVRWMAGLLPMLGSLWLLQRRSTRNPAVEAPVPSLEAA